MSLIDLPYDIKYLIFSSISDIYSLISLSISCKELYQVFETYKSKLINSTYINEITTYHYTDANCCILFENIFKNLKKPNVNVSEGQKQLDTTLIIYSSLGKRGKSLERFFSKNHVRKMEKRLIEDHVAVRKLARVYVESNLYLENQPPDKKPFYVSEDGLMRREWKDASPGYFDQDSIQPADYVPNSKCRRPIANRYDKPATLAEFTRICNLIYKGRIWLILLDHNDNINGDDLKKGIDRMILRIMNHSSFWDVVGAYCILEFFRREITTSLFIRMCDQLSTKRNPIIASAAKAIRVQGSNSSGSRTTFESLGNAYPEFYGASDIARLLFCGKNLTIAATVYDFRRQPQRAIQALEHLYSIHLSTPVHLIFREEISRVSIINSIWVDLRYLQCMWSDPLGLCYPISTNDERSGVEFHHPSQDIPLKRLVTKNMEFSKTKMRGKGNWTEDIFVTPGNCVWEDWRLESWGLHEPRFES